MKLRTKCAVVFGTRPEAIKLAPLINLLEKNGASPIKISTGQHLSMLWQALELFGIDADYDLGVMREGQSLPLLLARIVSGVDEVLARTGVGLVIVQGDTMTALGAGMAAYFRGIPVAHVEAGLRTFDDENPFPEEMNRVLLSRVARWHFCPTEGARENLIREGVPSERIKVTGNTVIDALIWARQRTAKLAAHHWTGRLRGIRGPVTVPKSVASGRFVLVTSHRRENFGKGLEDICAAIRRIIEKRSDVSVIWPVHLNPAVREEVEKRLDGVQRVHRIPPVDYPSLLTLFENCYLILTDSGGIQEEAPLFHKPVLIMRDVTERPEILDVGAGILVGTDPDRIVAEAGRLLDDRDAYLTMARAPNPFGDGHAAERIVEVLCAWAGEGQP